jgi:acetyltransferase-like isoleucine patch superfamily enzyme
MSTRKPLEHDWYPAALPDNVTLGDRSWCYSAFAFLHYRSLRDCGLRVGHDSGLYNGTFFDLGPAAEVVIGNYTTVVGAIFATNRRIEIGDYCLIAHEVVFADSSAAVPGGDVSDHDDLDAWPASNEPSIVVGENCWIGARAILLAGARLGQGVIVGAGTIVDQVVPDYAIIVGNPARIVGWAYPSATSLAVAERDYASRFVK